MQKFFRSNMLIFLSLVYLSMTWIANDQVQAQGIFFDSTASGHYQSVSDSDSASGVDPMFGSPVTATSLANPSGDGFSYSQALAEGQLNTLGATLRSFSYASGYDPNFDPPTDVQATSTASAMTSWTTSSGSVSSGTAIEVRALIPIHGILAAEQYFGSGLGFNDVYAEASAEFSVDGTLMYSGSARLYDPDAGAGGTASILVDQGAWAGEFGSPFVYSNYDLSDPDAREISTFHIVSFTSTVGQMHNLDFSMTTSAYTLGPFESLSVADFSSTGEFSLTAHDINTGDLLDVDFSPVSSVPEPGGGLALAAMFLATLVRRRRSTCHS